MQRMQLINIDVKLTRQKKWEKLAFGLGVS